MKEEMQGLVTPKDAHEQSSEAKKPKLSGMDILLGVKEPTGDPESPDGEITKYLASHPVQNKENPLVWWKGSEKTLPILAKLARKYLTPPATSVPAERVFSAAGNIINEKRSCLSPDMVNVLIFLSKN